MEHRELSSFKQGLSCPDFTGQNLHNVIGMTAESEFDHMNQELRSTSGGSQAYVTINLTIHTYVKLVSIYSRYAYQKFEVSTFMSGGSSN